jgi:Lon protease-like protein
VETPLFPLHTVLFPGAQMPIRIFEPRYRALLDHVLAGDRRFGVAAIRQGMEVGGPAETYDIGCIATIEQLRKAENGGTDIAVLGIERFRILARLPDDPFPNARIEMLAEAAGAGAAKALTGARAALHRYLSVVAQLQGTEVIAPALPEDVAGASFTIAAALQLDLPDRQRLLECETAAERLERAAECARSEALLLEAVGPSVGRPAGRVSMN